MSATLDFAVGTRRMQEQVIGIPVDVLTWADTISRIFDWAQRRESRTVCVCDVHSVVHALRDITHADSLRSSDLATPDGAPVAWMIRRKGHLAQERINGPDLMWACCQKAAETGTSIFLYGTTPSTLQRLERRLREAFPSLNVAGAISPPFRALSLEEDAAIVESINRSGAQIVWVGLGCPKQEAWMQAHRGEVKAVMVGVGAALDFHAGVVKRAPIWMQRNGLEWFHRVLQDPRRLAKRYLISNAMFIAACCGARWSAGQASDS
jgi:N-acetylglucosaminyldiphosphoundecaprenol N-acetyl-beta-D-mannosaminyltransferase